MEWFVENWPTIAAILGLIVSLIKWVRLKSILRAVIAGVEVYVEDTGNPNVKRAIEYEATEAGVQGALDSIVQKETK